MKSLEEIWGCIEAFKEDMEELDVDVTVTAGVRLEGHPEGSYAELAARLREACKDLEGEG